MRNIIANIRIWYSDTARRLSTLKPKQNVIAVTYPSFFQLLYIYFLGQRFYFDSFKSFPMI